MSENETSAGGGSSFDSDGSEQDVVRFAARTDANGASSTSVPLTPSDDGRSKEILCDPRPVIPVIFLPGVMGSLLVNKDTGDEAFFAPNLDSFGSSIGGLFSVIAGWFRSASSREVRFDPTTSVVTTLGPINVGSEKGSDGKSIIDEAEARRRGWGSVHRWSYHPILSWLEKHLNEPAENGKLQGPWVESDKTGQKWALNPVLGTEPTLYGSCTPGPGPITAESAAFKKFSGFRYRVYAIGYNWLQSNDLSGKDVVTGSDFYDPHSKKTSRLMGIKEICEENHTGKAIVLTHSMGGLVARFAVINHGADAMLHGVFHNVQPATGAPIAAKRFRTGGGTEGGMNGFVNGSLLGRDESEFIAVAANAPGPLELLPMPDYNNGKPWWIFSHLNGDVKLSFPEKNDTLNELFLNSKWYGLLPSSDQLDPAGTVKKRLDRNGFGKDVDENYSQTMYSVVGKQTALTDRYFKKTYVSYGDGALMANGKAEDGSGRESDNQKGLPIEPGEPMKNLMSWGTVVWTADSLPTDVTKDELLNAKLLSDSGKGELRIFLQERGLSVTFTAQKLAKESASGRDNGIIPGDGTVPAWSADAQARGLKPGVEGNKPDGVKMAFVQGGYQHQFSYMHPWTRWSMLYSLVQIVNDPDVAVC